MATLGPACTNKGILLKMIREGVNVCRLNFSHGTHEDHLKTIETIREINRENDYYVSILCDLQGPKIRLGKVKNNKAFLEEKQIVRLVNKECLSDEKQLYINYSDFVENIKTGHQVLINDGNIELKVLEKKEDYATAEVVVGGEISSNKGVNLPDTLVTLPSLTKKDLKDLDFILEQDADWIALSFVREPNDIIDLRNRIDKAGKFCKIISKIEKPEAIKNLDEIIQATDGVMVARGDLGVEMPMEELPIIQKEIVRKCNKIAKPVIIATQMMESMIENPRPTRAEANDVGNAVLDGTDAVMLSGETSVGKYPVEVIQAMSKIIERIENEESIYHKFNEINSEHPEIFLSDAICQNAVGLSQQVDASAIIGMTFSGYTAFKISSHRPSANVFIFSKNTRLLTVLNLLWGVRCYYYNKFVSTDETFEDVVHELKIRKHIEPGDVVIHTASMPIHQKKRTNSIKVNRIK